MKKFSFLEEICPRCSKSIPVADLPKHKESCGKSATCPICSKSFALSEIEAHAEECSPEIGSDSPRGMALCPICSREFLHEEIEEHASTCTGTDAEEAPVTRKRSKAAEVADFPVPLAKKKRPDVPKKSNKCPICGMRMFAGDMPAHMAECHGDGEEEMEDEYDDEESYHEEGYDCGYEAEEKVPQRSCPVCKALYPVTDLESHVNDCLEKSTAEAAAAETKKKEQERARARAKEDAKVAAEKARRSQSPKDPAPPAATSTTALDSPLMHDPEEEEAHTDDEFSFSAFLPLKQSPAAPSTPPSSSERGGDSSSSGGVNLVLTPTSTEKQKAPDSGYKSPVAFDGAAELSLSQHGSQRTGEEVLAFPTAMVHQCPLCGFLYTLDIIELHIDCCKGDSSSSRDRAKEKEQMDKDEEMAIDLGRQVGFSADVLNRMQLDALLHVQEQSKAAAARAYPTVLRRIEKLGFNEEDLKSTLKWIRDSAPIIIHVNLTKTLHFLAKDTHYRNQFETRTSGGTLDFGIRREWENRMFNRIYDKSEPFDRVKYGVLNIVNDPEGVYPCRHYGDSYLVLRDVRLRTTFASMDTGSSMAKLASCEYYTHVLQEYSEEELRDVLNVGTRKAICASSKSIRNYKEIQIHGPVELKRDVEAIVVNSRHRGDKKMEKNIEEFARKNFCNVIWME